MCCDYTISIEGIRIAECSFAKATQKIANFNLSGKIQKEQGADQDVFSLSGDVDLEAALIEAMQAKNAAKANMKFLSQGLELEQTTIDMIG